MSRIIEAVKKHKTVVILYFIIIILLAILFGYKKYKSAGTITPEMQALYEKYEEGLTGHDRAIAENKDALTNARKTADNLQQYVDNSIYMKLDSEAVKVLNLQYVLEYTEETDMAGVQNSLTAYINDGELIADIQKISPEEEIKYLKEVLSFSLREQDLSIAVMHYSDDKMRDLSGQIETCLNGYMPVLNTNYGPLKLNKICETYSVQSDAAVVNTQNGHTNNLRSYKTVVSDLEIKATALIENRNKYIENNSPEIVAENPVKAFLKTFVAILLIGIGLFAVILYFLVAFGNIAKSRFDIESLGIEILGLYNDKNGYSPDSRAVALNIKLMADKINTKKVLLGCLTTEEYAKGAIEGVRNSLSEIGIETDASYSLLQSGSDIEQAIKDSLCILVIKNGYTKISEIRDCKSLCRKFNITLSDAILIE